MPDYTKGKIYKIVCNITGEIYIGSTIQPLSKRLTGHVNRSKKLEHTRSKDIILRGDYNIVLIENYSCNSKEELFKKEREHIENNICVNRQVPTRTTKEWREDNIEKHKTTTKIYNDKTKHKRDEYREKNREEINRKVEQVIKAINTIRH
jgi:hypothetical protein